MAKCIIKMYNIVASASRSVLLIQFIFLFKLIIRIDIQFILYTYTVLLYY